MSSSTTPTIDDRACPRHVAIIMDGNGRWAQKRGKLRASGHKEGIKAVRTAVEFALENHLDALTLYAFSSENWKRPAQEVTALMELFVWALDSEAKRLHQHGVRLQVIGDIARFNTRLQQRIDETETLTQQNNGLHLNIAANYGGRWDIVQAVRQIAVKIQDGSLRPENIEEETIMASLCLNELPPVDLVIRTGGEHRISNFLLWQVAYAEFFFTDILWPDFDKSAFRDALLAFSHRERRFGRA